MITVIKLFVIFIVNAQDTAPFSSIASDVFYYEHTHNLSENSLLVNHSDVSVLKNFESNDIKSGITKFNLQSIINKKSLTVQCDVNTLSPLISFNGCTNCSGCIQNGSTGSGEPACYKWTCTDEEFGFCAPIASNCCVGVVLN